MSLRTERGAAGRLFEWPAPFPGSARLPAFHRREERADPRMMYKCNHACPCLCDAYFEFEFSFRSCVSTRETRRPAPKEDAEGYESIFLSISVYLHKPLFGRTCVAEVPSRLARPSEISAERSFSSSAPPDSTA